VDGDITCEELLKEAGQLAGIDDFRKSEISRALAEREKLSTQAIPEYGIVFLHAKTEHVPDSVFALIRPAGGIFFDRKLAGIKSVVVMLVPKDSAHRHVGASSISAEIFGAGVFLELVRSGDENGIRRHLEKVLDRCLCETVNGF